MKKSLLFLFSLPPEGRKCRSHFRELLYSGCAAVTLLYCIWQKANLCHRSSLPFFCACIIILTLSAAFSTTSDQFRNRVYSLEMNIKVSLRHFRHYKIPTRIKGGNTGATVWKYCFIASQSLDNVLPAYRAVHLSGKEIVWPHLFIIAIESFLPLSSI